MQIISGKYKGHKLSFKKDKLRPSQSKVREALFDILQTRIISADFLDLCAGTGAIGLEAISRGANKVVMVDANCNMIFQNILILDLPDQEKVAIKQLKVEKFFLKNQEKFDLIFFDPPWHKTNLYQLTLNSIFEFDILKTNGLLIIEHAKKMQFPWLESLNYRDYIYGDTVLKIINYEKSNLRR